MTPDNRAYSIAVYWDSFDRMVKFLDSSIAEDGQDIPEMAAQG